MTRRSFYGLEAGIPLINRAVGPNTSVVDITHPEYDENLWDWDEWRLTYRGGRDFVDTFLKKFSRRETSTDFQIRKALTPIPAFAAAAVDEVKNSIFQRATDITRVGGPRSYVESCKGNLGGVDRRGATMNFFVGDRIIPELLTMKKIGVFVDMPEKVGPTRADQVSRHPYIYTYKAEDIRSWTYAEEGEGRDYSSVLLRTVKHVIDGKTGLPSGYTTEYRNLRLTPAGNVVEFRFDEKGKLIKRIDTELTRIPFVCFEISNSLLKNISRHQIALLNLGSSDVNWITKAGFPFYIEQYDERSASSHLRRSLLDDPNCNDVDGDCETIPSATKDDIDVGSTHGRRYAKGLNAPDFIAPPTEPLQASMEKQRSLRDEIRMLVNLNLSTIQPKMASAESKGFDQQGLEAGLSYIGLELENGERKIAEFWAMYEGSNETSTVIYPKRYSLKSEEDQQAEVKHLLEVRKGLPSLTAKREITKRIATLVVGSSVSGSTLQKIHKEIDRVRVIPDDPASMLEDIKANLLSLESASEAKGYPKDEIKKAAKDAEVRLKRVQEAQAPKNSKLPANPAARGLPPETDPNPDSGKTEKQDKPRRGQGK